MMTPRNQQSTDKMEKVDEEEELIGNQEEK